MSGFTELRASDYVGVHFTKALLVLGFRFVGWIGAGFSVGIGVRRCDVLGTVYRLKIDAPRLRRRRTWNNSYTRLNIRLIIWAGWCIGVILRIGNRVASRNEQGARLWIFSRLRVNNGLLYGQGCGLGKLKRHRRGHSRWRAGCEYIGS